MDHFGPPNYACKPSLIAVYSAGPFGGVRAAIQMRAITGELGCISIQPIFAAPTAEGSLTEAGEPVGDNGKLLKAQATLCLNHLEWVADALKKQREAIGLPKPK